VGSLTALQRRALVLLAGMDPPWTLTGGGALAGFILGHRDTRDLDLFWHGQKRFEHEPDEVARRLVDAGFDVHVERSAPTFRRLHVSDGVETLLIDLVADPVAVIEPPVSTPYQGAHILVDTPHEILVNKLTTLLSRSELRDLVDVKALVERGGDLDRALRDAPQKDGGFSPPTLAWLLGELHLERLGAPPDLVAFRDVLVERLLR
jgi:Nucleotidyl transferase AbiEii toxin, Type IV TA system